MLLTFGDYLVKIKMFNQDNMIIDKIKKAIELVRKTGDKIILFEGEKSDGVVIMSMEEYERLAGVGENRNQAPAVGTREDDKIGDLTEDELIDRINRNIAVWQSQNQNQLDEYKILESFLGEPDEDPEEETEDNLYYYSEENFFYPFQSEKEEESETGSGEEESEEEKEEEEQEESEPQEQGDQEDEDKKSNWEIPVNIKKNAEEVEE